MKKKAIGSQVQPMVMPDAVYDFAKKIAKTMKDSSSSHVFFLMQQAFGEEMEWEDVENLLDNIITLCTIHHA
jgi:hypothetical protein